MRCLSNHLKTNNRIISIMIFCFIILLVSYLSLNANIYGSDAGRIWQTSKLLIEDGADYPINTLMPLLSTTLYSIFLAIFGYNFQLLIVSGIFTILTLLLLWRFILEITDIRAATISLIIVLLFQQIFIQSYNLRPYAMANFTILLSLYLFNKYSMSGGDKKYLIFSAIFITLAIYMQNLFLICIAIPFIYFILSKFYNNKMDNKQIFNYYLVVFMLLLPWLVYRFFIAEFDFYRAPYTWMYSENLWQTLNRELFNRPLPRSNEYYSFFLNKLYIMLKYPIIIFFTILGLLRVKNPLFLAWIISSMVPIAIGKIPTEPRYLFPFMCPLIILISIGMANCINICSNKCKTIIIVIIIILITSTIPSLLNDFNDDYYESQRLINEFNEFNNYIKPGENIYFRSHIPVPLFINNRVYPVTDLDLDDAIYLITWQSDDEVIYVMDKYNIKWVILYNSLFWESRFHEWTIIATGQPPLHYIEIKNSSSFIKIDDTNNFILYEYINHTNSI